MTETEFIELTENNQRTEALLNTCVTLLTEINNAMPGNPNYVFHKEKIQVVSDKLSHIAAQVHIIQSTLNRIYPEAKPGQ